MMHGRTVFLTALVATTAYALPAPLDLLPRDAIIPSIIPGEYVITLKDHDNDVASFIREHSAICHKAPGRTYEVDSFKGFSMQLTGEELAALQVHPSVASVESDMLISGHAIATESRASWGLSRLSQGANAASDTYSYDESGGEGTCSYVIDTGVAVNHPDFEGRAVFGVNFEPTDGTDEDLGMHGTHCAGTIGSKTYGVAKKTKIIAVKACNKAISCRYQDIVSGLAWVTNDSKTRGCPKGAVINLSLGGWGNWVATREAVNAAVANGIFVSVAAGNSNKDASNVYPASAPNACTVAASDSSNNFASFSNFGPVIDIIAPGVQVTSLSAGGGTSVMSGTSMAAPFVAGLGAYLLSLEGSADPVALCQKIKDRAVKDAVRNVPSGTNNLLVYNGAQGAVSAFSSPDQSTGSGRSSGGLGDSTAGGSRGDFTDGSTGGLTGGLTTVPPGNPMGGLSSGSARGSTGGFTGNPPRLSTGGSPGGLSSGMRGGGLGGTPGRGSGSGLAARPPTRSGWFGVGQGPASRPGRLSSAQGSSIGNGRTRLWSSSG